MKLLRDYAVLAGGQVLGKVAGFVAFAWLARALGPVGYGAVEYVVGLSFVFGTIVEGGFGTVAVRRVARAPELLPVLAAQVPRARLALALLAVPAMLVASLALGHRDAPFPLVLLFALSLLTIPWRQEWLLQAAERMADAAWVQLLRALVFAALVVWWVRGTAGIVWVGAAEVGSVVAATAYCIVAQRRHVLPRQRTPPRGDAHGDAVGVIREGVVVGLGNIVLTLQQYIPLVLAPIVADATATPWFAAAARVTGSLLVFSFVYHYSLYPAVTRATRAADGSLGRLLDASFHVSAWVGVLGALALTLVAEPVARFTFGAAMAPAASTLAVMAWGIPVVLCSGHARWSLAARGAQGAVLNAQLAGLAATAVVGLAAGHVLGAPGLGAASVAGLACVWAVAHRMARSRGVPVPSLTALIAPLVTAAVLAAAVRAGGLQGWWALAGAAVFVPAALLIDRRLRGSLRVLAAAKADVADAR